MASISTNSGQKITTQEALRITAQFHSARIKLLEEIYTMTTGIISALQAGGQDSLAEALSERQRSVEYLQDEFNARVVQNTPAFVQAVQTLLVDAPPSGFQHAAATAN